MSTRRGRVLRRAGFYILVLLTALPVVGVFYYMISTSLKTAADIASPDFKFLFTPTLDNYIEVFVENEFLLFFWNSMIVGLGSTLLGLLIGIPAAYAIAKHGVRLFGTIILAGRVAPGIALLIPWFVIFSQIGWTDTYQGLILAHLLQNLPMMVFLLIGFFEDVPDEIIESASVDGARTRTILWSVVMPVAKGGIAATAILGFLFSWNHFMFSIVLSGNDTRTLPVAVFNFMSYGSVNWGAITAAAATMALPAIVLTLFVQRHIVQGLSAGAVKG